MFTKDHWRTENIVQGLARIPLGQVHAVLGLALAGGVMFSVSLFLIRPPLPARLQELLDLVPPPVWLLILGFLAFCLFFPLAYIVYLAKELQSAKDRIEKLETQLRPRGP